MCVTNAMGFFILNPQSQRFLFHFVFNVAMIAIGYAVLLRYRHGRNWARWMVMLSSLSTLWNLHYLWHPSATFNDLKRVMLVTEAPLGAFLLVYLNLQQVRRWFLEPEH